MFVSLEQQSERLDASFKRHYNPNEVLYLRESQLHLSVIRVGLETLLLGYHPGQVENEVDSELELVEIGFEALLFQFLQVQQVKHEHSPHETAQDIGVV